MLMGLYFSHFGMPMGANFTVPEQSMIYTSRVASPVSIMFQPPGFQP